MACLSSDIAKRQSAIRRHARYYDQTMKDIDAQNELAIISHSAVVTRTQLYNGSVRNLLKKFLTGVLWLSCRLLVSLSADGYASNTHLESLTSKYWQEKK